MKNTALKTIVTVLAVLCLASCQTNTKKCCADIKVVKKEHRYKVAVCDWMILKRQKVSEFSRAAVIGCDGLEVDFGGLGKRPTFDNKLIDAVWRKKYKALSDSLNIEISSLAMSGFYSQNFAEREGIERIMDDVVNCLEMMGVKTAFLPLGVEGDLIQHPERRESMVARLQQLGTKAEAAGVVIGIESAFNATEEVKFLEEIGSSAVKSYFNFANAVEGGRNISDELKILGKERIAMIHASNKDSVWLENDPHVNLAEIKKTLDEMDWSGWLVVERSRDASQPKNVIGNYSANVAYLKKIFQAE